MNKAIYNFVSNAKKVFQKKIKSMEIPKVKF